MYKCKCMETLSSQYKIFQNRRCYLTWVNLDKILPSEKKKWFISSIIVYSVFHLDKEFETEQSEDLCRNGRDIFKCKYSEL